MVQLKKTVTVTMPISLKVMFSTTMHDVVY